MPSQPTATLSGVRGESYRQPMSSAGSTQGLSVTVLSNGHNTPAPRVVHDTLAAYHPGMAAALTTTVLVLAAFAILTRLPALARRRGR